MKNPLNRREFIRQGALAGLGAATAGLTFSGGCRWLPAKERLMMGVAPTGREAVRVGFVGIGNMGSAHVKNLLQIPNCQITAVCDIREERTAWAKNEITTAGFSEPAIYGRDDWDYKRMCDREDLDLVYNAAPWRWHAPISLAAMECGKHAASEVNLALTIDDCWKLVETSERTRRHCAMMENCCYDRTEMIVLNMIRQGVFGEILHGECGYLHDLRAHNLSPTGYQGMWRIKQMERLNGNTYPTHGIGPMAWCMDIHRGDAFDYLVSMNTPSTGINELANRLADEADDRQTREHYASWAKKQYAKGDVNITLIKTKLGKTIICKHDTSLPRPYSRDFLVQGSKGLLRKYPSEKVHIEGLTKNHEWEDMTSYNEKYLHPVWQNLEKQTAGMELAGHGGMDYIEDYRLIQALRSGLVPDIDVYDSVAWSAIIPMSNDSSNRGSKQVKFPDFTRGQWKVKRPLQVDLVKVI
jgi:predicted dehydrogenase